MLHKQDSQSQAKRRQLLFKCECNNSKPLNSTERQTARVHAKQYHSQDLEYKIKVCLRDSQVEPKRKNKDLSRGYVTVRELLEDDTSNQIKRKRKKEKKASPSFTFVSNPRDEEEKEIITDSNVFMINTSSKQDNFTGMRDCLQDNSSQFEIADKRQSEPHPQNAYQETIFNDTLQEHEHILHDLLRRVKALEDNQNKSSSKKKQGIVTEQFKTPMQRQRPNQTQHHQTKRRNLGLMQGPIFNLTKHQRPNKIAPKSKITHIHNHNYSNSKQFTQHLLGRTKENEFNQGNKLHIDMDVVIVRQHVRTYRDKLGSNSGKVFVPKNWTCPRAICAAGQDAYYRLRDYDTEQLQMLETAWHKRLHACNFKRNRSWNYNNLEELLIELCDKSKSKDEIMKQFKETETRLQKVENNTRSRDMYARVKAIALITQRKFVIHEYNISKAIETFTPHKGNKLRFAIELNDTLVEILPKEPQSDVNGIIQTLKGLDQAKENLSDNNSAVESKELDDTAVLFQDKTNQSNIDKTKLNN